MHLRLRVKLTVVDQHKTRARENYEFLRIKRSKAVDPSNNNHCASSMSLSMKQRVEGGLAVDPAESSLPTDNDAIMQPSQSAGGESESGNSVDKPMDSTISLLGQGSEPGVGEATPYNGGGGLRSPTSVLARTTVTRQYQLCQYGHPEPGRNIVVRSAILVKIHGDAFSFLSLLGHRYSTLALHAKSNCFLCLRDSQVYILLFCLDSFEDEYVRRGYSFLYGNLCRISVFKKYKVMAIYRLAI